MKPGGEVVDEISMVLKGKRSVCGGSVGSLLSHAKGSGTNGKAYVPPCKRSKTNARCPYMLQEAISVGISSGNGTARNRLS